MSTSRHHADNGSIVHLTFSNKKIRVVIKTYRHVDTIFMSCLDVGNIGGGSNHGDMPTCQHAENILCFTLK